MELKLNALVSLEWVDSNFTIGWHQPETQTAKIPRATTVGFVTALTEEFVEIASSIGKDGGKLNPLTIPLGMVVSVKGLEEKE